jgi:succinyl-diaminopimelate desuccinylase
MSQDPKARSAGPGEPNPFLDPLAHAQALIRCPSVTPLEGGALDYLQGVLEKAGFRCWRLPFSEPGLAEVDNLYARIGEEGPHVCFAGHTDVVPPGDEAAWTHPPFAARIDGGLLYGRGAADMKGGVACAVAAALRHLCANGGRPRGSISFLITGDEEGVAVNGTRKVVAWMRERGEKPDCCLLGEPTCRDAVGDTIKIGRRGSLSALLTVTGVQGHVAYPHLANNPLRGLVRALASLYADPLDEGSAHFPASNLEVTSVDTGNTAVNVIPARAQARFNVRFNDLHNAGSLERWLRARLDAALDATGLSYSLGFEPISDCFFTSPGAWVETLSECIRDATGIAPAFDTSGGASDGRFLKDLCPVVEFGLRNATIHKVDEQVAIEELTVLTDVYERFLMKYLAAAVRPDLS